MYIIYILTSPSKKQYIGQTKCSWSNRWLTHVRDSKYKNGKLQNAIRKYGKDSFIMNPLITNVSCQEDANNFEILMIRKFNTFYSGYNLTHGGRCHTHTQETRKKISKALKGKKNRLGTKNSSEVRRKISLAQMGNKNGIGKRKKLSNERRQKISLSMLGNTNGLGCKFSDETRKNIRVAQQKRRKRESQLL